jgi:hypothetical protein
MEMDAASVGVRVRANRAFAGVPRMTEGVIDQVLEFGQEEKHITWMVAWDLPSSPLPDGYHIYDGRPAALSRILRDGFSRFELKWLDRV